MKVLGKLLLAVAAAVLLTAGQVGVLFGQVPNVISVDFEKSILSWDPGVECDAAGQPVGCGGPVIDYHVHCKFIGGVDLPIANVPAPTTQIPMKSIISQTGKYECFVTGSNTAGVSGPSATLPFDAGRRPAPPVNLRIGVIP